MTKQTETLVDVYGKNSPKAARLGVGATPADIQAATYARRAQRPGEYRGNKPADLNRRYDQTNG